MRAGCRSGRYATPKVQSTKFKVQERQISEFKFTSHRQRCAPPILANRRGVDFREGSGHLQGLAGTDLRIVTYGRSRNSKVVLFWTGEIKSCDLNEI